MTSKVSLTAQRLDSTVGSSRLALGAAIPDGDWRAMDARFHEPTLRWLRNTFASPTRAQILAWPLLLDRRTTLLLAPTGSGKTLAAFLAAIDRLMFAPKPPKELRLRVIYVSPLKALGVDVERNLRVPLEGIAKEAAALGIPHAIPRIAVRSGDTPQADRARFLRAPADILITTPESLYLLLTSEARKVLATADTLIVDEIHSLVPTKRGAHLFLSLERLESLRQGAPRLQRIGLSATQRPLQEVARLLAGGEIVEGGAYCPRPVDIVDAGTRRALDIRVEMPSDESASQVLAPSLWPALHQRLVELVRAHRSTLIFVNSRRLAERLAGAINDCSEEELALAHHGSLAKEKRKDIEDRLKAGQLRAIVATSSLELGIDMGAVDLVLQIEAPPGVASGLQRIGRAGHQVNSVSCGVIFPKNRGDLLACVALLNPMLRGEVEDTYYPRNPLDVLAQQVVAMVAGGATTVETLFRQIRQAAPFAELPRSALEGVLDMLSGRYPSDAFSELRPRLIWNRTTQRLRPRTGARQLAVLNGGTIPDRGLYGVFLASPSAAQSQRVGELDEEMVFECRPGEVFLLGASSWRIESITHDQVLVSPAPGQPGKMPFWHGDRPGRSAAFGATIGRLARELVDAPPHEARSELTDRLAVAPAAAEQLLSYLREQVEAGQLPTDKTLVIERFPDDLGDLRVCLLSAYGGRVHAAWALAVRHQLQQTLGITVDMVWSDDGIAVRLPEAHAQCPLELFLPSPDTVEQTVTQALSGSALFAARFRENAARALLLPRRRPGKRSPLWLQRRKSADLLAAASAYPAFPILLETFRECLVDVFDLPALKQILSRIQNQDISIVTLDRQSPSPFAASLLFSYVANFIYNGDAPLAERRAQALTVNHSQLRELLGDREIRGLLDPEVIRAVEDALQHLGTRRAESADALHDLLRDLGDLELEEVEARVQPSGQSISWLAELAHDERAYAIIIRGRPRWVAAEHLSLYHDALGAPLPRGAPETWRKPVAQPLQELIARYARTHGPFTLEPLIQRYALPVGALNTALAELERAGRVVSGSFLPSGTGLEWCDSQVLRQVRHQTLKKLRSAVDPVTPQAYARFLAAWHGVTRPARGRAALEAALEKLQGLVFPVQVLLEDILPARVPEFSPLDLDLLCAEGAITWRGAERVGEADGRIALYLTDQVDYLAPKPRVVEGALPEAIRQVLEQRGALFFHELLGQLQRFPRDVLDSLWDLVWAGQVTNDTLAPLRSLFCLGPERRRIRSRSAHPGRRWGSASAPVTLPGSDGRWSLVRGGPVPVVSDTLQSLATVEQLLERHGILVREMTSMEGIPGGFSALYPVLKALEEAGKIRRGYFVSELGATQFAAPGAEERLRACRLPPAASRPLVLSALDPANPYGAALDWPPGQRRLARVAGAQVILRDGALCAYLSRGGQSLTTFLPEDEAAHRATLDCIARSLANWTDERTRKPLFIADVDGLVVEAHAIRSSLRAADFLPGSQGYLRTAKPCPSDPA